MLTTFCMHLSETVICSDSITLGRYIHNFVTPKVLRRGSWGSPDPLSFSDSGACLTCLSGKVTDVVDTLNNFEQNPSYWLFCFRIINLLEIILKDITFFGVTPTVG